MTEIPFHRELLPPGFNAGAVAFTVATVQERGGVNHKLLACLLAIVRHVNDETGLANVGYDRLMLLTGSSRRNTISDWLKQLRELGYIEKDQREGMNGSNVFRVPILTYLPVYGAVGVSETGTCTNQHKNREKKEDSSTSVGSMSSGNRYSDELQPLPSREMAVEQVGERPVVLSEHFTQAFIDHGKKHARYFSDAYRPRWLHQCARLHDDLHYEVLEDIRAEGTRSGSEQQLSERVEAEIVARCDAVFGYVASYQGDDPRLKHLMEPVELTPNLFNDVLRLAEAEAQQPHAEAAAVRAQTESITEPDFKPHKSPAWYKIQELRARRDQNA